jgi:hypothetical protein
MNRLAGSFMIRFVQPSMRGTRASTNCSPVG